MKKIEEMHTSHGQVVNPKGYTGSSSDDCDDFIEAKGVRMP